MSPSLLKGGGRAPSVPMVTPPGCPEAKAHALEKELGVSHQFKLPPNFLMFFHYNLLDAAAKPSVIVGSYQPQFSLK